jgi:hypothetical protein
MTKEELYEAIILSIVESCEEPPTRCENCLYKKLCDIYKKPLDK